jgi:recombination protein RecA
MRLGEGEVIEDIQVVSTGSLGLDIALGVGGLPRGRVIEIYGPESSGKTTLTLQVIAEMQKTGGQCAFVDAEHALDIQYAQKLGVNLQDLLISQPDTGEQALEIVDSLVRSGAVDLIVVDSVAALTPKAELEGEMGDSLPGLQARLMSQALRKLTAHIKKTNCMVIFINQIRMKIGVMFGSPETTTGGNALKFYASVRLDIRRTGTIKKGEESIGNETKVKVVKNKVAPPFKTAEFDILFGEGISRQGEIIDMGVNAHILDKSGAWYAYNGEKIGQGRDNAREFLRENPELSREIENKVRESLGIPLLPESCRRGRQDPCQGQEARTPVGRPDDRCLPHCHGPPLSLKGRALRLLGHARALPRRARAQAAPHATEPAELGKVLDELQAKGFIDTQRVVDSVVHRRAAQARRRPHPPGTAAKGSGAAWCEAAVALACRHRAAAGAPSLAQEVRSRRRWQPTPGAPARARAPDAFPGRTRLWRRHDPPRGAGVDDFPDEPPPD